MIRNGLDGREVVCCLSPGGLAAWNGRDAFTGMTACIGGSHELELWEIGGDVVWSDEL